MLSTRITLATLIMCVVPVTVIATDDCTFDQAHQAAVISSIANRFPGGSANVADRKVTWVSTTEGTTTFGYGGCVDLGSVITRSTRMTSPRTQEQVFALARELATKFWSNDIVSAKLAAETLISGIYGSKYSTKKANGKSIFAVSDPGYVQLYVEHEYISGIDSVVIAWQGNF